MVKKRRSGGNIRENINTGFGIGLGFGLSNMIFIVLGIMFFLPGFFMLKAEKKKDQKDQNKSKIYLAFGLMFIGCILGIGMGFGFILSEMGDMDF